MDSRNTNVATEIEVSSVSFEIELWTRSSSGASRLNREGCKVGGWGIVVRGFIRGMWARISNGRTFDVGHVEVAC